MTKLTNQHPVGGYKRGRFWQRIVTYIFKSKEETYPTSERNIKKNLDEISEPGLGKISRNFTKSWF
jgi:hypothetical protein